MQCSVLSVYSRRNRNRKLGQGNIKDMLQHSKNINNDIIGPRYASDIMYLQFIDFVNQEMKLCICMHSTKHVLKTPNGLYMPLIHPLIKFGFICIVNLQLIKLLSKIIIRHYKVWTHVRNNKRLWYIVKNLSSLRNRVTIFTLGTTALKWFWLYTVKVNNQVIVLRIQNTWKIALFGLK